MSYITELERINNIFARQLDAVEKMSKLSLQPSMGSAISALHTMGKYTSLFNKSALTSPFTSVNTMKDYFSDVTAPINNLDVFSGILSSLKASASTLSKLQPSEGLISAAKQIESMRIPFENNNFSGMIEALSQTQKILDLYKPELHTIKDNVSSILNNIEALGIKDIDTSLLSSIDTYTDSSESLINSTDKLTSILKEKALSGELTDDSIVSSDRETDALTQNPSDGQTITINLKRVYKAAIDLMTICSFILAVFFDKTGLILEKQDLIISIVSEINDQQDSLETDVSELKDMLISLEEDNQKLSEQIDELTRSNQELTVIVSQLSDDIQNQPR